jgi:hypothetical protein
MSKKFVTLTKDQVPKLRKICILKYSILWHAEFQKKKQFIELYNNIFLRKAITSTRVKNICSYTSPINIYFSQKKLS